MRLDDKEARMRVMDRIMREIHHIPIPARRPRYGRVLGLVFGFYSLSLAIVLLFYQPVGTLWRWLIGTAWVAGVEWALEHPWGFLDTVVVGVAVVGAAWVVRARGQSHG